MIDSLPEKRKEESKQEKKYNMIISPVKQIKKQFSEIEHATLGSNGKKKNCITMVSAQYDSK
jgi:hypothetical protein